MKLVGFTTRQNWRHKHMKRSRILAIAVVILFAASAGLLHLPKVFAQWGAGGTWTVPSGGLYLNCPPNACSVSGQTMNFPGLSAFTVLTADYATTSSTATLINAGALSFPIAANEVGHLDCEVYFTNTSGGGLELGVNGPGTPTEITARTSIFSAANTSNMAISQGTSWAAILGAATSTVTTIQPAHIYATIENGTTAGTLNLQFADVNTTGPTTLKRDSWCTFP
jgi:hypothetical protein